MTLDHYIPRCLTRPWHDATHGRESLRVFDFQTGTFAHRNSRKLFARPGINAAATEAYLNQHIETPFSAVQDKIVAAGTDMRRVEAAFGELPHTALTGLYWLQVQRIRDAHDGHTEHHLDEFAGRGIGWLEGLSAVVFEKYEPLLYVVPGGLYFPDSAIFTVPLVDQMPAIALPIHTRFALVFADRTKPRDATDWSMTRRALPTALSLGLQSRRVIVPPEFEEPPPEALVNLRAKVRELFTITSEAAAVAGMPVWRLNETS